MPLNCGSMWQGRHSGQGKSTTYEATSMGNRLTFSSFWKTVRSSTGVSGSAPTNVILGTADASTNLLRAGDQSRPFNGDPLRSRRDHPAASWDRVRFLHRSRAMKLCRSAELARSNHSFARRSQTSLFRSVRARPANCRQLSACKRNSSPTAKLERISAFVVMRTEATPHRSPHGVTQSTPALVLATSLAKD
jgi:hypothetical protein